MFSQLTEKQKAILECEHVRAVVNACPGSGKTYSVAARLAKLLKELNSKHKGIAVISFTRIAGDEIKKSLSENYGITKVGYPHFIGTIDSFINQHLFLPYGHLLMRCSIRPEIVGTEFNQWYEYDNSLTKYFNNRITGRDPNYYFDKVSFDSNDKAIKLLPPSSYHFSWDWKKLTNKNGTLNKKIQDIIDAKWSHFNQGKANQADANYFSLKLLEKTAILESLTLKYSHLIIDEAQDTTDIQMKIIDKLDLAGIKNIMLVGDPHQAIFEWNTADSELFISKYNDVNYFSIDLDENRRSSSNICNLLNAMVTRKSSSIADVKNDTNIPLVTGYSSSENVHQIKSDFLSKCEELGIPLNKSAVLFRGKKFGEEYFQLSDEDLYENHPWKNGHFYVRDIVHGKFLIEKGKYKEGLKLLEKGYHKLQKPDISYTSQSYINSKMKEDGFRLYRKKIFDFIDLLPEIGSKNLNVWVAETNSIIEGSVFSKLNINLTKAGISITSLFHKAEISDFPYTVGTIHSVKGQTFDAVLLYLKKDSATKNYSTLLSSTYNEPDESKKKKDNEELRLIYVACSRPKRLLWVAAPNEDQSIWKNYFGLNEPL